MAISYNAVTNRITLDGVNTYTLLDIYNADVAGAWGVVSRQGGNQYLFACNMFVGDGTNATKIVDSNVAFQIGASGALKEFRTLAGASFEMTRCLITFHYQPASPDVRSLGLWKFSSCAVYLWGSMYPFCAQTHERTTIKGGIWYNSTGVCSYDRCKTIVSNKVYYYTTGTINDWTIEGIGAGYFRIAYNSPTVRNSTITVPVKLEYDNIHATFINTTFTPADLVLQYAANYLLDKWEFNLLVTDKDNNALEDASVILRDKNGDIKHTELTGADGKLATTWEVLANRYDGTSETKTEYNPFTLTISKTGYADYETIITIDHIVKDDQIVLERRQRRSTIRF